jgi:hypothetical protein
VDDPLLVFAGAACLLAFLIDRTAAHLDRKSTRRKLRKDL